MERYAVHIRAEDDFSVGGREAGIDALPASMDRPVRVSWVIFL